PDQPFRQAGFLHHEIAGVYAGRTVHTLHLRTVSYINARGAYLYALHAVNAVPYLPFLVLLEFPARLSPPVIIRHYHGVPVQQHALQAPIRAHRSAYQLPHKGKYAIERPGEHHNGNEASNVRGQRVAHNMPQLLYANDIGQENIGDPERERKEQDMLDRFPAHLVCGPGAFVQQALRSRISFYPVFYAAKKHFHENGLRADPPAKEPAKGHGEQRNEQDERHHGQAKKEKILRPENGAEQDELSLHYIEHQQGPAVYLYK